MNKQTKRSKGTVLMVILGLLISLLAAYGHAQELGQEQNQGQIKEKPIVPLQKVAVLPFLLVKPDVPGQRMVKGLYGNYFFRTGDLPARAGSEVTTSFHRQLKRLGRCELIAADQAQAAAEGMDPKAFQQDPIGVAAQIGRELGLDAVVIG